ncbi:ABC transporter ATP-binding protein [Acidiphilium sp. AL]|uniref:ABC transporter ATP-binding protein n=1 Tax=Acidiphilium iwatense TaxID=768198 RepID=A0ABS9E0W3_9PROT|nr:MULTISPECIES: ABC transporter ATP-binding protein [Acidiphilium]MCF3948649.1 ABC transporter ATP-binding protein [Acidiphilium iwatense]MCU4161765.1 ABC transporter ATP-binding protein [Acidiphilium sp. AL]
MSALLELQGAGISFGGLHAVDDLSFAVEKGHIVALIGPNGAGKTTVFNMITGVYRPTKGKVCFQGQEITGWQPHAIARAGIMRTFQTIRLFPAMSVFENVRAGGHLRAQQYWWQGMLSLPAQRREETALAERTHEILCKLDLDRFANEPATSLPYGVQRRVELARTLAAEPKLVILDEPAAGLNDAESSALNRTIFGIRDSGITVLLVEHDMNVVMNVTDHIVVINFGRKIAEGNAAAIRSNPQVIEAYLGRDENEAENVT